MSYAEHTSVPVERSRAEVERLLIKYGHQVKFSSSVGGCWKWSGYIGPDGYGSVGITHDKKLRAHRLFWLAFRGQHEKGLVLDHLCRNRDCVNPAHLDPVSRGENVKRGNHPNQVAHRKNECRYGHKLTPENLYLAPKGERRCRICNKRREENRKRNKNKRTALAQESGL